MTDAQWDAWCAQPGTDVFGFPWSSWHRQPARALPSAPAVAPQPEPRQSARRVAVSTVDERQLGLFA